MRSVECKIASDKQGFSQAHDHFELTSTRTSIDDCACSTMRRLIATMVLVCGLLFLVSACAGEPSVDNKFRFENYYSVWTGWKGGSKANAKNLIQDELEERFPRGTDVEKLVSFFGSYDPTFKWNENPSLEGGWYLIASGYHVHLRRQGSDCAATKEKDQYTCTYRYQVRSPYSLFILAPTILFMVDAEVDEKGTIRSLQTKVNDIWK